jgi:hypothetical protein
MSGWLSSMVRCVICTHTWAAVYPAATNEDKLECPSCGAQDSQVIERTKAKPPTPETHEMTKDTDDLGRAVLTSVVMGFSFAIGNFLLNLLLELTK